MKFFKSLFITLFIVLIAGIVAYCCFPKVQDWINQKLKLGDYKETFEITQTTREKIDLARFPEFTNDYNFILTIDNAGRVVDEKLDSITNLDRIKSLTVFGYKDGKEVLKNEPELTAITDENARIATIPTEFALVFGVDCSDCDSIQIIYELNGFDKEITKERSNKLEIKDYTADTVFTHLIEV